MSTQIQWTDDTWNPVTGCSKVSAGCKNCYAEKVAERFWPSQYPPVEYESYSVDNCCPMTEMRARRFTDVQCHEDRLDQPLRWRKPRRVFVNSMSDLFHEDVPDAFIDQVFAVMALAPQHTFQILTKRAERMRDYFLRLEFEPERIEDAADWQRELVGVNAPLGYELSPAFKRAAAALDRFVWPLSNVWLGVSVENQRFLSRIDALKDTPAAVHFVSFEPLLEDLGAVLLDGIDWAIIGGESGPKARPFDLAWARSLLGQCQTQGVFTFMKQVGSQPFDGRRIFLRDKKGGDPAEWTADLRVREYPR